MHKTIQILLPLVLLLVVGCTAQIKPGAADIVVYRVGVDDINEKSIEVSEGGVIQYEYEDGAVLPEHIYLEKPMSIRGKGKNGPRLRCSEYGVLLAIALAGDIEISDFYLDGCGVFGLPTSEGGIDAGHLKVTNSRFINVEGTAIEIEASTVFNITVDNVDFEDTGTGVLARNTKIEKNDLGVPLGIEITNSRFIRTQYGAVRVFGLEIAQSELSYNSFEVHPVVLVAGCTFLKNSLQANTPPGGAAIYAEWTQKTLIDNCRFLENTVSGQNLSGGAVHVTKNRSFRLSRCFFSENTAEKSGGALLLSTIQITEILQTKFTRNTCTSPRCRGGAVSWEDRIIDAPNPVVKNMKYKWSSRISDCQLEENIAGFGGGINADAHGSSWGLSGYFHISRTKFSDNVAQIGGGGLSVKSKSALDLGTMSFFRNRAEWGGGVMLSLSGSALVLDSQFEDNSAATSGGSIFSSSLSKLTIEGVSFKSSSARTVGGAIVIDGVEDTTIDTSNFFSNTAAEGAGIYFASRSLISNKLFVQGCTFNGNQANRNSSLQISRDFFNGAGGALVINSLENPDQGSLEVDITGSHFQKNQASGGGALFIATDKDSTYRKDSRNIRLKDNTFLYNSASEAGGLLLVDSTEGILIACKSSDPFWKSLIQLQESSFCPGWLQGTSDLLATKIVQQDSPQIPYGQIFASFSVGKLIVSPTSVRSLSGLSIGHLVVTALDLFDQEMTSGVIQSGIEIRPSQIGGSNITFAGEMQARVVNGKAVFSDLSVIGNPGSYSINLMDFRAMSTSNTGAAAKLLVELRDCVPGELKQTSRLFGCIQCTSGLYSFNPMNKTCDPCPRLANCSASISDQGDTLRHPLVPQDGYWHSTPFSTQIQKCLSEDACTYFNRTGKLQAFDNPYSEPTTKSFSQSVYPQCTEGHHGVLCGACDEDYGHTGVGECTKCQVTWWYIIVLVVTRCLSLLLVITTLRGNMTSEDDDLDSTDIYQPMGSFRQRDLAIYTSWRRQRMLSRGPDWAHDQGVLDEEEEINEDAEQIQAGEKENECHSNYDMGEANEDFRDDDPTSIRSRNFGDEKACSSDQLDTVNHEIVEVGCVPSEKIVSVKSSFLQKRADAEARRLPSENNEVEGDEDGLASLLEPEDNENPRLKVTEMIKIMINFAQVTGTAFLIDFAWPPGIRRMVGLQDLFASATVFWGATECALPEYSWMPKSLGSLVLTISNPITISIFIILFWIYRGVSQNEAASVKAFYQYIVPRLLVTAWSVTFFFYDSWTESFMKLLYCPSVDEYLPDRPYYEFAVARDRVWAQDTDVLCFKGPHRVLFYAVGVPGLVLFTIGVPIALFLFIVMNFKRLEDPKFRMQYGFMYLNYDLEYAYWESAIMVRKAAIVTIAVLAHSLGQSLQGLFMLGIIFLAVVAHTITRPLPLDMLDNMETWSLLTTAITFFSAVVFSDPDVSSIIRTIFSIIVYLANALFLVHFSYAFVYALREFVITYKYGEDAARELGPHLGFFHRVYYMASSELKSMTRSLLSMFKKKKRSRGARQFPRVRNV